MERWQDREGPSRSAFRLSMELVKKDNWYPELLYSLRETGHSELANAIEGKQSDSGGTGPGVDDDDDEDDDDRGPLGTYRGAIARKTHGVNRNNSSPSGNAACTSDSSLSSSNISGK